ncbi:MAG: DegQ family serine endoprotease [Candidatus Marinimicrobia bacterium]|nr:DegQ family serine endoprotease [Candidatus Neomarinimicrobiota bacterium]
MKRAVYIILIAFGLISFGFYAGAIYGRKGTEQVVIYDNSVPSVKPSFVRAASLSSEEFSGRDFSPQRFNEVFSRVAQRSIPGVVTIVTEKVIKRKIVNPFFPEFDDDWFWQFFGSPPETEMRGKILGSGVIVSDKGYILTNNHVVEKGEKIHVELIDKRQFEAEVVGKDPLTDLAVLKIDADNLSPIPLGDSDSLKVGEWVLAIGCPLSENLAHTVTAGIVSAKGRSNIINPQHYEYFIQTDAAINPGNSGGALVNLRGELVGINTAIATSGQVAGNIGIGFAIPINLAKKVMKDLIEKGKVVRAWLGVWIQDVNDKIAKSMKLKTREGALVSNVEENSPAEKAGLQVGDVIIEFDNHKVKDSSHLRALVANSEPGSVKEVVVLRSGKEKRLKVKLGELPGSEVLASGGKESRTSKLGLRVSNITPDLADRYGIDRDEKGVVVVGVERGTQAYRVFRLGDVIKRVGNKEIENVKDFKEAIKKVDTDVILFLVKRGDNTFFVTLDNPK